MIQLNNIVKRFNIATPDETTLFDGFNFHVDDGEFVSIIGSNGSGKTTMLRSHMRVTASGSGGDTR